MAVLVGGLIGAAGCTRGAGEPIDYRVTGGFGGRGDGTLLRIELDGAATRDAPGGAGQTQTAQLPQATIDDLLTKVDDANFATLDPVYACTHCADDLIHAVSAGVDSGGYRTVQASELAAVPPALKTVIDTLQDIHDGPFDWH